MKDTVKYRLINIWNDYNVSAKNTCSSFVLKVVMRV